MRTHVRHLPIVALLAILVPALGGCNEVNALLDEGAGKNKKPKPEETAESSGAQSAREKLDAYYNREPRKVEHDPNDPIVPCRLPSGTKFMRKNDCFLRGGSAG